MRIKQPIMKAGLLSVLTTVACQSAEEEKTFEPLVTKENKALGMDIGTTESGERVMQKETRIKDKLMIQELANSASKAELEQDFFLLKDCYKNLADPRLGGSGNAARLDIDLDELEDPAETEAALTENEDGQMVVVERENLMKKLQRQRTYAKAIKTFRKQVVRKLEDCKEDLQIARRKVGLPSEKIYAKGYFTEDGTWVETSPGEQSLDDAFEIRAKRKKESESESE